MVSPQLTPEGLYPDRIAHWHKRMGPPESFPCCAGSGTTLVCVEKHDHDKDNGFNCDVREVYCDCAAGKKRTEIEST